MPNLPNIPPTLAYCHATFLVDNGALNVVVYAMLAVQASTCLVYVVIRCQNERHLSGFTLTSRNHDLGSRFALWANVKAAKWMLPVSVLHCVVQGGINLASIAFRGYFRGFSSFYFAYLSIQYCVLAIETVMHPLICIR
uniref:Uncharacterized protein n=1 Tax=Romanomermis culicivorax TaxID=13658 RepID=A0A915KFM1_ROMCU